MAKQQRKFELRVQDTSGNTVFIRSPLTIDFDIEKRLQSSLSNGSITVYNLGEDIRNAIYKDMREPSLDRLRLVELFAGYEGESLSKIFSGTISHCYSLRQGVDFLTTIEVNSGSDFFANSYVTLNVAKGTAIKDHMADLAYKINPNARRVIGDFSGSFKRNVVIEGFADKLLKNYSDGHFFMDGDTVIIMNENEAYNGAMNIINSDAGLLGSPQREDNFLIFDIIFEPRLLLGQYLKLESTSTNFFNGVFKVVGFKHSGTISESVCGVAKTTVRLQFFGEGSIIS